MKIFFVENTFQLYSALDIIGSFYSKESKIYCFSSKLYAHAITIAPEGVVVAPNWELDSQELYIDTDVFLFKDIGLNAVQILGYWRTKSVKLILVEEGLSLYALKGTYSLLSKDISRSVYRWLRRIFWYLKYGVWDSGEFGMCLLLSEIYLRDIEAFRRIKNVSCKLVEYQPLRNTISVAQSDLDIQDVNYALLLVSPWVGQGYASKSDQIKFIEEVSRICGNNYKLIVKFHPSESYDNLALENVEYIDEWFIPIEVLFGEFRGRIKVVISQGSSASVNLSQIYGVKSIVLFPDRFMEDNFLDYSEVLSMFKRNCEVLEGDFIKLLQKQII